MSIVDPNTILPSQDFLKPKTVEYIFECIKSGELEKLPPAPLVRKNSLGQLVAIDGHNLIAVKSYLNQEIEVHIATSNKDGLEDNTEASIVRNNNLEAKFESVLKESERVQRAGILNFKDLIGRYPELFK